jgi:formylglycine-generating enzyme required for sulfatase activity
MLGFENAFLYSYDTAQGYVSRSITLELRYFSGMDNQTPIHNRHVFISYRRSDADIVNELIAVLGDDYPCWRDTARIRGGQVWRETITRGIDLAYAMILIISPDTQHSKEVYAEYFYAQGRSVPVIPFLISDCDLPFGLENVNARLWFKDKEQSLEDLREDLAMYRDRAPEAEPGSDVHTYLRALQFEYLMAVENYTPMAGAGRYRERPISGRLHAVVMRPEFGLRKTSPLVEEGKAPEEVRSYDDLMPALHELDQVLVLGEPGSGKTTTLYKFAHELQQHVFGDADAPIPVIVPLREWLGDMSWKELVSSHLGVLAPRYGDMLSRHRLYLLLDGLNEIPRDGHRWEKLDALRQLLDKEVLAVVTCRELDYRDETLKLDLDATITIHHLDPERILDFLKRYLADAQGEKKGAAEAALLFWHIAGGEDVKAVWGKWHGAGASLNQFFESSQIPENVRTSWKDKYLWEQTVKSPGNLMHLASNPYLLWMFLNVHLEVGGIPSNRGALFDEFVFQLLKRERLTRGDEANQEGQLLMTSLSELAWVMQRQAASSGGSGAIGSGITLMFPRDEAIRILGSQEQFYKAASANLLEDAETVRFSHQLMQEYFSARRMLAEIGKGHLSAEDLWPSERWWQPCGWEEITVLSVGMREVMIDWLLPVNPEVAALCIQRSGVNFSDGIKLKLRNTWLPQMTDLKKHRKAAARAAIGRALGMVRLQNGEPLDNRTGVGLTADGIPDIEWVDIPGGSVQLKGVEGVAPVKPFKIAQYPVTNIQFEAFVKAKDGYGTVKWSKGFENNQKQVPEPPYWSESNAPRETVTWYEAVAFCRWLTEKYRELELLKEGEEIRLPMEWEWQQAATGGKPENEYPWGRKWRASRCNTSESGLGRTTAVGLYPKGTWTDGPLDMAGNVWELCLNKYDNPLDSRAVILDESGDGRVVRGGSWILNHDIARCANRRRGYPYFRYLTTGFRCARTKT